MTHSLKLCEAVSLQLMQKTSNDAELVMQWRNDPQTLKASFHQKPKEWQSFFAGFSKDYFATPDLPPFFVVANNEKVGVVQLEPIEDFQGLDHRSCEISLHICPEKRRQGYGNKAILLAVEYAKNHGYEVIFADIRPDNFNSQEVFKKAGFRSLGKSTRFVADLEQRVLVERMAYEVNRYDQRGVFVIAEAGSNWRMGSKARDMAMAKVLIDKAKEAGADAVKFQVFKAGSVYAKNAGSADYLEKKGEDSTIEDIFKDLEIPDYFIPDLFEHCNDVGIEFMASTFSVADFNMIDPYVKRHKIASYEISHKNLLQQAAFSKKPLILSTGAANIDEVGWAVNYFKQQGGKDLSLLQCTAKYPAEGKSLNLRSIPFLKKKYGVKVGLSDHSRHPLFAPIAAVALGAKVIEKHYTLDNGLPGPDHSFAITANELKEMVQAIRETQKMMGSEEKSVSSDEKELRYFASRAVQANRDIEQGEVLKEGDNIDILRPGKNSKGVHPRFLEEMEGKVARRKIPCGSGIQQEDW